ncbi:MAG: surface antigen [Bacteroidetes bacterium]|nr:surface antigen [Bacteroidota bacterium]
MVLFLSGCTGLRLMPRDEVLYTGSSIEIISKEKIQRKAKIKADVNDIIKPKPNTKFLGMRPGLWLYYLADRPRKHHNNKRKTRDWIKNKLGEAPVYLNEMDTVIMQKAIEAKLYNTGFLDARATYITVRKKKGKTAEIHYQLHLNQPYTIKEITFPPDTDGIGRWIARSEKKSLIKKGNVYSLDDLVNERARIDELVKRHGYYFFNRNFLEFLMDTVDHQVTLHVRLKSTTPEKSKVLYRTEEINVYPDYMVTSDSLPLEHLIIDSINYYKKTKYIRPRTVLRSVYFRPGHIYDSRIQRRTLGRLNNLGVFKYINLEIKEIDTSAFGKLAVNILLAPLPKNSLTTELQAATKSNNFIGPGLTFSLRNRNAFRGAELLIFNLQGSFESQYNGVYKGQFTYQVNPRIEIDIPRIIPFKFQPKTDFIPHTKFGLDYSFLSRVGYFDMNSFKFDIGYRWKQSMTIEHALTLLNVTYYNIYHRSETFNSLIDSNPLLKSRFDEQFLFGIGYSFFYTEQQKTAKRNRFYFNGNVELSGNVLALGSKLATKRPIDANNPSKVFGVEFAQFARFDIDVRDYIRISNNNLIALRFIAGWGLPYGNSNTLPYAKQFFSGGAYSLRGFPANSVGPGGYTPPAGAQNIFALQQGGEIKLEFNAEYRFPIFKFLKGAVFYDAGNTWLNKANINAPNGEFRSNLFLKQIAMSTGAGLRVDLSFFVLRFDVGLPLRSPAVPESERWVINHTKFNSLTFNLAFGYPF